ncbi:MAG TPA: holo-ACP synthase [Alphaproteobacteria bacterium]|nr:holo-ACP synthase [Alphaproteobacteria bacterium]
MILGIGVDLVDMRRIERLLDKFGDRFIQKIFTQEEQAYANQSPHPLRVYANRFAAKEAAAKALGTGFREGIGWQDIEVSRASSGAPSLYFHRKAYEKLVTHVPPGYTAVLHVSFSDEPPYSTAFVVISAVPVEHVLV